MPESTATDYARRLKEAGLLSTGARGVNAPEMTPLDAARFLLAVLTTPSPAQCVERVQRFGQIKYSPNFRKRYQGYQTIQPEEFGTLFQGETLEQVLASLFGLPQQIGIEAACVWFQANVFHLRVHDFDVLAELYSWVTAEDRNTIIGERVVPFKGEVMIKTEAGGFRHVEGFTPIKGGVRTTREIAAIQFSAIGFGLMHDPKEDGS
ncbi:MAG: hypothetical protein Q8K20_21235 [Gemmobacter sp.]|nr:hypothetical protein [Gemmobacter sp.]